MSSYHILLSYGAWNEITSFMESIEVVRLQALHPFMYKKGVARCQSTLQVRWIYFCLCESGLKKSLIEMKWQGGTLLQKEIQHDLIDFSSAEMLAVKSSCFVFKAGDPV